MTKEMLNQRDRIFNALCMTLSERIDRVEWNSFSENDWLRFAYLAQVEGVAPLIHWMFKNEDYNAIYIPTTIKAQLTAAYYNTTAHNQIMYIELQKILNAFSQANIPVIVIKGAVLATTVYSKIGLRPMGDLDLLVPEDLIDSATRLLVELGFVPKSQPSPEHYLIDLNVHLWKKQPKCSVEIHKNLIASRSSWYSPTMDWFWDQSIAIGDRFQELVGINLKNIFRLTPTAHILYQSAHIKLQHRGDQSKMIWFYDLDLQIRRENTIDWEQLTYKAKEFRWGPALLAAVCETRSYLGTPIPETELENLSKLQDQQAKRLVNRKANPFQNKLHRNWNKILGFKWLDRIKFLILKLFPNPSFIIGYYRPNPSWLWPLWYPIRWLKILSSIPSLVIQTIKQN
jgi:hypothetical protein